MGTSDKFINRIREFIVEQKLLEGISNVVVGVSGGADSVCLFEVFCTKAS